MRLKIPTVLVCASAALGCETQPTHEVLTLTEMAPRQVEVGDRIELRGNGFPLPSDIRRITLTLRGSIARPGMPRCERPVTFTLSDPPEDSSAIDPRTGESHALTYAETAAHTIRLDGGAHMEFIVTAPMLEALTQCPGERATSRAELAHATMSVTGPRAGVSVRVETLQGTTLASARALRGPVIDLLPQSSLALGSEIEARAAAERAMGYMGLQLAAVHPAEGGLQVERVVPGSPGDEAGIADGDVLQAMDGVRLLSLTDARPAPGAAVSVLSVRRGDTVDERPVRIDRLDESVSSDWVATGVLLAVAMAALGFFMLPTPGLATWLRRRLELRSRLTEALATWRRSPVARQSVVLAVAATVSAMPVGPWLVGSRADAGTLFAVAVLAGAVLNLWRARSLMALGRYMSMLVPALLALTAVGVSTGALGVESLAEAQGGWIWQWNLFKNPLLFVLGCLWASALLTEIDKPGGDHDQTSFAARVGLWRIAEGAVHYGFAFLGTALFLGAWSLPGVSAEGVMATPGLQMVGSGWMVARAFAVFFAAQWVRAALATVSPTQKALIAWRFLTPLALLTSALWTVGSALSWRLSRSVVAVASTASGWAMFLVVALGVSWAIARRALARLRPPAAYMPDPFGVGREVR